MRTRFGLLGGVLILALGAGVAALAYQAGVEHGAATSATGGAVVVYGGGPWGFGIFGVLFGLFFLFLLARLVIGVTFGAFGRGHGPWAGYGHRRWGAGPDGTPGTGVPGTPWGDRETFVAEMHRRLHERDAAAPATPAAPGPTPAGGGSGTSAGGGAG